MIAYEIQSSAICNPRQNSVQEKIQKNFLSEKKLSQMLSRTSSEQSELSQTNRCLLSLSGV